MNRSIDSVAGGLARMLCVAAAGLPAVGHLRGQEVVPVEQAAAKAGQNVSVKGTVTAVSRPASGHVYLNFGGSFPNQVFSVFIRSADVSGFTDLDLLQGREVTVAGMVETYNGKPQIIVTSPAQIVSAGAVSAPAPAGAATGGAEGSVAPSPAAFTGKGTLAGLTPGRVFVFEAALSPAAQKLARASGNPGAEKARVGIGVPAGFDLSRPWPILVVFTTSDGDFSHVNRLNAFVRTANTRGWVVLAADGPAKPPRITTEWCWAMLSTGLDVLEKEWPGVKQWPMACGGNSGGAKMSALMAGLMASEGLPVVGVFLGGCNEDLLSVGMKEFRPPAAFKKSAIFLSSGAEDRTATPASVARVAASMKASGFRNVRLETFAGGHLMNDDHVAQALDWFASGGKP